MNKSVVLTLLVIAFLILTRESIEPILPITSVVSCVAGAIALMNLEGSSSEKNIDVVYNAVLIMTLTGLMAGSESLPFTG